MRKLKVALVVIFAVLTSLGLFACGGKKSGKEIDAVGLDKNTIRLTDSDTKESVWQSKLNELSVSVVYTKPIHPSETIRISECTVEDSAVQWQQVGTYYVSVTPNKNNPKNVAAKIEVVVEHDFEKVGEIEVCRHDQATRTQASLQAGLAFKQFHTGDYTLTDQTGAIHSLGTIETAGGAEAIKTTTVGRLEKGMTITLTGTAKTTFADFGLEDKGYYFPIIGFADLLDGTTYTGGAGTSVIVRNEGWVLLDGVGQPRLIASLAGGANDTYNYGSTPDAYASNEHNPEGYLTEMPSDMSLWRDWHVYSTGEGSDSTAYADRQNIKLSWTYRDDGIIELTYVIFDEDSGSATKQLVCRVKAPDNGSGYYDTVLHGEYVDMTFSRIETIQTKTLTGVVYKGLAEGQRDTYLENEILNYNSLNVAVTYRQTGATETPDKNFDVEAYVGAATDAEAQKADAQNWVSLKNRPLDKAAMKAFRITRTVGNTTLYADVASDAFVTIKTNAVDTAYGHDVRIGQTLYANNGAVKQIAVSMDADKTHVLLSVTGRANTAEGKKYVAFRIWAREGASTQFKPGHTVQVGENGAAVTSADGAYADVVLFVTADTVKNGAVLQGLVEGGADVKVDLSQMSAVSTLSEVTKEGHLYLDEGGKVTIVYRFATDVLNLPLDVVELASLSVNNAPAYLYNLKKDADGSYTGKVGGLDAKVTLDAANRTMTVEYVIPAFTVTGVVQYEFSLVMVDESMQTTADGATDVVYYDMAFSGNGANSACLEGDVYAEAIGTKLYLAKAWRNDDLQEADIRVDTLNLNLNAGTLASLNYLDLHFGYLNGEFTFGSKTAQELVNATLYSFGTLGNAYDTDYGAVAVLEIDLEKLETLNVTQAPFYFELNANGETAPAYVYRATAQNKIEKVSVNLGERKLLEEGDCYTTGYAAYEYKIGNETVFLAGAASVGGSHNFVNNICMHCGAERAVKDMPLWSSAERVVLAQGDILVVETGVHGFYTDTASRFIGLTAQIMLPNTQYFYWARPDMYVDYLTPSTWTNREPFTEEMGKIETLFGAFPSDSEWRQFRTTEGARLVVTFTLTDGQLVMTEYYYAAPALVEDPSGLFLAFSYTFYNMTADSYVINLTTDTSTLEDAQFIRGHVVSSKISGYETSGAPITVGGREFTVSELDIAELASADGCLAIEANGIAKKLSSEQKTALGAADATHYVAFRVNLSEALGNWFVELAGVNGYVAFNGAHDVVEIVIPLKGGEESCVIDFRNFAGDMQQSDVRINLANVVVSEVSASVTENTVGLAGGTAKIVYAGVPAGAKVQIGATEKTLAELASAQDFGNGISAVYANNVLTLTVAKPDYTKTLPAYRVNLLDAEGGLLMQNRFDCSAIPADGVNIEGTYAVADGEKLTLVVTEGLGGKGVVTKEMYVNANKGAASESGLVRLYNTTFTVNNNVAVFAETNALTSSAVAVYSAIGNGVAAITLDLSALGISAADAYAFEVRYAQADEVLAYGVNGKTIAAIAGLGTNDARKTVLEHSCDVIGISASAYPASGAATFYYNIVIHPTHTWGAGTTDKGVYTCTVCGATVKTGDATGVVTPALAKKGETSIVDTGISVSFVASGITSDWGSAAVVTGAGNVIITMPNLDPWNVNLSTVANPTEREIELAELVKSTHRYPAAENFKNGFGYDCYYHKVSYATVTISKTEGISYYLDGKLAIQYPAAQSTAQNKGTVADIAELFLSIAERNGVLLAKAGVKAADALIERKTLTEAEAAARYQNYLAEKNVLPEEVEPMPDWDSDPSAKHVVTLGTQDNQIGYTDQVWKAALSRGEKLELTGTMTSAALQNWQALLVTAYSGMSFDRVFRSDNYIVDGETSENKEGWTIAQNCALTEETEEEFWASVRKTIAKCNVTVTFDWTQEEQIVITLRYDSDTENYENGYVQTYTIESASGELAEKYTVGLGIEGAYAVFDASTRS